MEILLIVLFNFIVFFRTFSFSIVEDDVERYREVESRGRIKSIHDIKLRLYGAGTFGTSNVYLDHMFTTFLHTCICVLIYIVFGSFVAAILYSCNPANSQTSIWLNGRRYQISVILVLLMLLFKPYGLVLYPLTFMNYQTIAVLSPLLIDVRLAGLILVFVFLNRKLIQKKIKGRMNGIRCADQLKFKPSRIIIMIKSFGFYFFNMLIPIRVMMNCPNLFWWGITKENDSYKFNLEFYKGVLALILSAIGVVYFKDFMFIFMLLTMLQWCGIFPFMQINSDRYMCLANVFMMYFLSKILWLFPISIPCFVVYYLTQLSISMLMYKDMESFYRYQLFFAPDIIAPRCKLIVSLIARHKYLIALYLVEEGLRYTPTDWNLLSEGAVCLMSVGNYKQAREFLDRASKNFYLGQEEQQAQVLDRLYKKLDVIGTTIEEYKRKNNIV